MWGREAVKAIVFGPGGGAISSLPSERNGFKLLPCFRGFVSGAGRQTTRGLHHVHPGTRNTKKLPSLPPSRCVVERGRLFYVSCVEEGSGLALA